MLNYIKSELYRAVHSSEIRETAFVLTLLPFLLNLALYLFKGLDHFRYGITSFSYSMVVSMPMIYCYVVSDIAVMLYESDKHNGTERNSIAYGISRLEIFMGKCIVSLITAFAILLLILPVYIGSAVLLLDPAGPTTIGDLLMEIPAVSLIAIASLILAILLLEIFDKAIVSILIWLAVWVFLPKILMLPSLFLGLKTDILLNISMWMPQNFFAAGTQVNMSECNTIWDTAQGMARCLISGAAGITVFGTASVLLLKKRDL